MLRLTQNLIKYTYQDGQFGKYARLYPLELKDKKWKT